MFANKIKTLQKVNVSQKPIKMKKIYIATLSCLILFLLAPKLSFTQDKNEGFKLNLKTDIMSRYLWRGLQLGGAYPSIQPTLELSKGSLAIGAWGAFSTSGLQSQEIDLYISFNFANDMFTFTLYDYFFPSDTGTYNYFNYKKDETTHIFEACLKFNGTESFPLSLLISSNIYGADARKANGNMVYSTYAELGYNFKIDETKVSTYLGSSLNAPGDDIVGYYGNLKTGIINLGVTASKELAISDKFSLPITTSLVFNPEAKKVFFVFGFSL